MRYFSVFIILLLLLSSNPSYVSGQANITHNTYVSNITPSSATFILRTTDSDPYVEVAGKEWTGSNNDGLVYILVYNLTENTHYTYRTSYGSTGYFTTAQRNSAQLPSHILYGTVSFKDGGATDGTVVIIQVESASGTSMLLSARVDNGYWLIDLSSLIYADGTPFQFDVGDTVHIWALAGTTAMTERYLEINATEDQNCGNLVIDRPTTESSIIEDWAIGMGIGAAVLLLLSAAVILRRLKKK